MPSYPDRPSLQGDRPTGSEQGVESPRSRLGVGVCVRVRVQGVESPRSSRLGCVCVCGVVVVVFGVGGALPHCDPREEPRAQCPGAQHSGAGAEPGTPISTPRARQLCGLFIAQF